MNENTGKIKNLIDQLTDDIRRLFELTIPAGDLTDFVTNLGGTVIKDNDRYATPDVYKTGDESFTVVLPRDCRRPNVETARLIGVLFLEMGFACDEEKWNGQPWHLGFHTSDYERVMKPDSGRYWMYHYFGHALLMPKSEYTEVLEANHDGKYVHTDRIAEHFRVDVQSAWYRGYTLGLLQYM